MQILGNIDDQFWLEVARKCGYATFFHTPLWQRLAIQTYPHYQDVAVCCELKSGVRVVLPLLETRSIKGFYRCLVSTFAGCYGGLIADGPLTVTEKQQVYNAVLAQHRLGELHITGNPLADGHELLARFNRREDYTHLFTLDKDYNAISRNFSKGHRSAITQGRRMGVTTRLASSLSDYQNYYGAYMDSLRRWGDNATSRYPWKLFAAGYDLAREFPDHLKLWLAELEGKVIAGAWVFYWNEHVVWWHGASFADSFAYRPNNVLQADIIKDACDHGYKYYDFNPSGGHNAVAKFKQNFGAERQAFICHSYSTKTYHVIRMLARTLKV